MATSLPTITFLRDGEDGPHWSLIWDVDAHHMMLDLYSEGKCDWFYKNIVSGHYEGTEENESFPPQRFVELMPLFDTKRTR